MQINNQYSANQLQPTDRPLELKQGELYNAQIKERVSDTEAVIQIRGKEVKAIFEGKMPAEDRVTVQVTGQKDQAIAVKTVSTDVPKTSSTQVQQAQMPSDIKLLQNVGITEKDTLELKQSVQVLLNKGIPVTKEAVQELRDFFEKAQGSTAAKLDTVKALANKKLEVTQSHLRPIHEALHGRPLNEVLTDLAKEIDPEFDLAKNEQKDALHRQTQQNVENLQKQTVETTSKEVKAEGTTAPATASTTKAEQTGTQSVSKDKDLVDLLQKNRDFVEKAPELKRAIEKVRAEIVKNPAVDRELAQKVEKAAYEAEKLQSIGKERLVQALKDAEEQLVKRHQQRQENLRATVSQNKGAEGSALREATPREIVKAVKEHVSKTPSLQRSIETVQKQIVDNPKIPEAVVTKVKQAVEEAGRLQQQGRITAGKETLVNILNSVEADSEALESMNKNQQQVKQGESQPAKINPQQVTNSEHEPRTSEVVKQVKAEVQREPNLQRIVEKVRDQVINNPKIDGEIAQKVEKAVIEARQLQQIGRESMGRERLTQALTQAENELNQMESRQQPQQARVEQPQPDARPKGQAQTNEARTNDVKVAQAQQPTQAVQRINEQPASEIVKQAREDVQRDPDLQRAIEKVREQVVNNPKVDVEVARKVEKAVIEARQLQQIGRESMGRERLTQALTQAENELNQMESRQQPQQARVEQPQPDARPKGQAQTNEARTNDVKVAQAQQPTQAVQRINEQPASEIVKQTKEEVQRDPNLQRAIEKVRGQIVNNPKLDVEVAQKVEKAVNEARQLQQIDREPMGRERLVQALTQAENELKQMELRQQSQSARIEQPQPDARPKGEAQTNETRTNDVKVAQAQQQPLQAVQRINEQPASEIVKQAKEDVQRDPNLQRAIEKVREQVVNNPKVDVEVAKKIDKAVNEAQQLQQIGREDMGRERLTQALTQAENELNQIESRQQQQVKEEPTQTMQKTNEQPASKIVKQAKEEVQRDPNLQRAIEKVRDQVVNNPKIDVEVAKKIDKAVNEAHQLQQIGRETMGREHLSRALAQAESELKQTETRQQQQQNNNQNQTEQRAIETIKQIKEAVQNEPNIQRAIDVVRDLLKNNKDIDPKIINTIEKMTNQASQLDQVSRERISKILDQAVDQIKQSNTATAENTKTQSPDLPDENSTKIKPDQQQSQQKQTAQQETNQKLSQILANLLNQEQTTENQKPSPSAQLNEALKQIQKESNLDQAFAQIRKELLSNPNLDLNTIEKIEKAMERSTQLLEKGRELGARQQITNALNEIEQELTKMEPKQLNQPTDQQKGIQDELIKQFDQNEEFQTLPLQAKNILVTKVTQKLAQATHDFRELKREITKNLDTVERLIDTFKKNAYPQAKQMLETTISKLDNAILKSDMMLFTDMKTEKQLMQASSQLADAKKLLAKGNHTEAAKIVHDIKTLLDKINFKPSEQKVMHFVSKEITNLEKIQKPPTQQLLNQFDETARSYVRQEPSARQMFEMVRSLGLNHDSDLAKSLVFQKGGESPFQQGQQDQQQQENLKAVLMKLTQTGGDEASTRIAQQAEQALNNLTGQQLLSKSDSGNSLQSMFFTLPLLLGEKPENLQVFVHSKKEGQQVDWENCNLYFLIETKRLGDVGIMLTSTDRNLSITIKNDKPGFKQKMEPIAAITKEKLQEVGYSINSINFTRMTLINSPTAQNQQRDNINKPEHETQMRPVFTEKGMDFKI
ncbi:hypothetical protein [Schinkia azotoformans]|uniref:hypothetical protein n=2 Tax=Schinkia azotoformans TaxID=1454 RepID=UPI002DB82998|nr:hypothetical protein [Schinkia azotoformans]MEC1715518.1 hypothetical protein [Schinkia azotoformans]MEC1768346.1 hypothetical protein [Schinkia azotoformans]MEC1781507.1 hypothetical protein [Schinkia azotoformans]MED4329806.1 hypothetical protein [Schinkia azotoformans]MED4376293.1 hypothetical protein [Schinkia azotoformans]